MPNPSVPAAAEGVPSLIDITDQIGRARGMLELVDMALELLSVGGGREINALQLGVSATFVSIAQALEMLEIHRQGAAQ